MLNEQDLGQLKARGISEEEIGQQVGYFENGFPWMALGKSATVGDGIIRFSEVELTDYVSLFEQERAALSILKMVPASGAATRMFKSLFEHLTSGESNKESRLFFEKIQEFAFYPALKKWISSSDAETEVLSRLLASPGLEYGILPKGLLEFHAYESGARTPFEEHLVEAALYASDGALARLHFTVSPEHRSRFEALAARLIPLWEAHFGIRYELSFSEQKPSTDTVAVNMDNTLFRESDGSLLFRPAGHGALLENLNDLQADVIFIKNIDNVVPDALKDSTILYKKALGGLLVSILAKIESLASQLRANPSEELIAEAIEFMGTYLGYVPSIDFDQVFLADQVDLLLSVLARPTRVCGVVKNTGEPGGGPFWCPDERGNLSLQLVESAQVDMNNPGQKELFAGSTHFNPVDLVCAPRGLDLLAFRDMATGFITEKTKDGRGLKAQELPGLWNGAMAYWNTVFVEVPLETFNPVKTVTDLLRDAHQNNR
jgi:hypothetical protein